MKEKGVNMRKKSAFTLAELLIVLAILGVVVAVTLPLLKQTTPNQNRMMAKKAYMITSQIVEEMINDEDLYPEYNDDATTHYVGFDNTTAAQKGSASCSGETKFACLFKAFLNGETENGKFVTSDGIAWTIGDTTSGSTGQTTISVDVSIDTGTTNNPDTFSMVVKNDGTITISDQWAKDAIKMGQKNHLNNAN